MWPWVMVFFLALGAVVVAFPKTRTENARAGTIDDMNFPRADEGAPVNRVFGRVLVKGPNTLWAGDHKPVPITEKQKSGFFSSKKVIVGHTFFVGINMGLGIGPLTLHRIKCDKEDLWTGAASTDGGTISINKPNLFGGFKKGGGFVATARFYTGSWTQGINSYVEGFVGAGKLPAYRGTCHIVFESANVGESNQLRPLYFEVSGYTNGLELTGGKHMIGVDMNPAEIIYQAATYDWGGLDMSPDLLDLGDLTEIGEILADEANGMSLNISQANDGGDIVDEVMRQIDGLMYQDTASGKMRFRLIRNDYDIDDLPVFDESNILSVSSFTKKGWSETLNQVRVKYTNRAKEYKEGVASSADLSNISAQEKTRSTTVSYPGCNEGALAQFLSERDLMQGSVPTCSVMIEVDRSGADMVPGDPFVWSWAEYGIERIVMRAMRLNLGALNDGRIVFECAQDIYGISQTIYAPPSSAGGGSIRPPTPANAITSRFVTEAPYFFAQAGLVDIGSTGSVLLVAAEPPANSDQYDIHTSTDASTYALSEGLVVYTPVGTLSEAITATGGLSTGKLATLTITADADEIAAVTTAQAKAGVGMFFIGTELFTHEGVTDNEDGTLTLADVRRALLDTIPQSHSVGAKVWFVVGDNVVNDPIDGLASLRIKLTPHTLTEVLPLGDAPYDSLTLNNRAQRPMRPANVKFDSGSAFAPPSAGTGTKTITWANRSRLSKSVLSITDTTNEYEPGQQTVIRYKVGSGDWVEALVAPGVTTYSFNAGATSGQTVLYEIYSTRDGLDSFSKWTATAGAASAGGSASAPADDNPSYQPPSSTGSQAMTAGEALAKGDLVNIYPDSGSFKARKADASNQREAHGFVLDAVVSGAVVDVYFDGENDQQSGLTAGVLFLSGSTAGKATNTAPTATGAIVQRVGTATSATTFSFEAGLPVRRS